MRALPWPPASSTTRRCPPESRSATFPSASRAERRGKEVLQRHRYDQPLTSRTLFGGFLLEAIDGPEALRGLDEAELHALAQEIRDVLIEAVSVNGGHLGSNLGAVELTLALHRVFDSPRDAIVWDTGHQAYVHKLVTGRLEGFGRLRQSGGMSGW